MQCQNRWSSALPEIGAGHVSSCATAWVSFHMSSLAGLAEFRRSATRATFGAASFSNSNRFPLSSGPSIVNPVMFPPGRARLATSPLATGSLMSTKTTGTVADRLFNGQNARRSSSNNEIHLSGAPARPQAQEDDRAFPPHIGTR